MSLDQFSIEEKLGLYNSSLKVIKFSRLWSIRDSL